MHRTSIDHNNVVCLFCDRCSNITEFECMFETFRYLIKNMTMEEVTEPVDLEYATVIFCKQRCCQLLCIYKVVVIGKRFCVILRTYVMLYRIFRKRQKLRGICVVEWNHLLRTIKTCRFLVTYLQKKILEPGLHKKLRMRKARSLSTWTACSRACTC